MRKIDLVLTELRDLRTSTDAGLRHVHDRIDSLHQRIDTVIDSLADLRRDFDQHTHDS